MDTTLVRLLALLAVLALAGGIGLLRRARSGRFRAVEPDDAGPLVLAAEIAAPLGERATLLQFSTPVCRDCKATAKLLDVVAADRPGVVHVEIDAEQHLDLARRFSVMRAPTVLIADARGRVVQRASGVPDRELVLSALDSLSPRSST